MCYDNFIHCGQQLSTVHDTTLTIEDVTDIDDAIATTSSLLSPSTNDTENMFLVSFLNAKIIII